MGVFHVSLVAFLLPLLAPGAGLTLPLGIPPAPEDPVMQQIAPPECLAYLTWAGTTRPDPKSTNQTEQLLAEEEVHQFGAAILKTIEQAVAKNVEPNGPQAVELARDATFWAKTVLTHPVAIYVSKFVPGDTPDIRAGAIADLGTAAAKIGAKLEEDQRMAPPGVVEKAEIGGLKCFRLHLPSKGPLVAWAIKGNYLAIGVGEGELEALLNRIGHQPPDWLQAIAKQLPVPRRSMVIYVNTKAILAQFGSLGDPQVMRALSALGVDRITAAISVSGFDAEGMVSKMLLAMNGPPEGIFKLLEVPPLTPGDLAPIPADSTIAAAARLDAEKIFATVASLVGQIAPDKGDAFRQGQKQVEAVTGIQIQNDLLKPLGDKVCLYASPSEGAGAFLGVTLVLSVRDAKHLAETHQHLLAVAQAALAQVGGKKPKIEKTQFAGHDLYYLSVPEPSFLVSPSWCLTDKELVIALFPQGVKGYLGRPNDALSLAKVPEVAAVFAAGTTPLKLVYQDTPTLVKICYPWLQLAARPALAELTNKGLEFDISTLPSLGILLKHLRGSVTTVQRTSAGIEIDSRYTLPLPNVAAGPVVAAGLLLPAIQSARSKASQMQSMTEKGMQNAN
jgi:hypothetical protein